MTTALQIIDRAAEWAGYKDQSETLSGTDSAKFLAALNDLVGTWNTQRLYIPATTTVSASVSSSPVLIGPSQTLNTTRPIRIDSGYTRVSGVDYPIKRWLTAAEYDAIAQKSQAGDIVEEAFFSPGVPYGSIYLWPVPTSATLYVRVMSQLSSFADIATDYDLAQGYKRALEFSLAEELWPNRITPKMERLAAGARRAIKTMNHKPLMLESSDVPCAGGAFNIITGD